PVGNETPPDPRAIVTQAEIGPTRLRAVTHDHELGAGSDATLAPSAAVPGSAEASRHPLGLADARKDVPTVPVKLEVSQPLQASTWRESFADRVTWVANARQPAAEMQINPPNLGPVEIRVNVSADQANLSFYSPHAAVREAIQAALPRLQDSLSASGLTLGNVFVGAEAQSRQHPGNGEHGPRGGARHGGDFSLTETPAAVTWVRPGGGLGRVDLFA
ncbi:MAG: flagellar hook-length control protein FliK, partial [Betaproteobacteria bacterium]